jgi:hypothetical protein
VTWTSNVASPQQTHCVSDLSIDHVMLCAFATTTGKIVVTGASTVRRSNGVSALIYAVSLILGCKRAKQSSQAATRFSQNIKEVRLCGLSLASFLFCCGLSRSSLVCVFSLILPPFLSFSCSFSFNCLFVTSFPLHLSVVSHTPSFSSPSSVSRCGMTGQPSRLQDSKHGGVV